ncbi:MAG TPA: sporulation protein YqfD [Firmicutes bacterium]|nr:sporulation protein YqfD [Bacillota bacterium]
MGGRPDQPGRVTQVEGIALFWRQIAAYFRGYLVLKFQGLNPEKIINCAIQQGIKLWEVRRVSSEIIICKVAAEDFKHFRTLVKKTGCRTKILARLGLPFFYRQLQHRRGWLCGAAVFFSALYILASFVWVIQVEGVARIPVAQVMADLHELGLYPGTPRGKIEEKRNWLIRELKIRYPQTAFVSVELKGIVAHIELVEKELPPATQKETRHLYAVKDGLVQEIVVLEGTPQIKAGDMVSRGDLLILGKKVLRRLDGTIVTTEVKAAGVVKARVWYEVHIEEPLLYWAAEIGEGKRVVYYLRIKDWVFPFFSWGRVTGETRNLRQRFEIYKGRNQLGLVEFFKDTYHEVNWVQRQLTTEVALNRAREEGNKKLLYLLPVGVKPERLQEEWEPREGFLVYRLVAETLENIAVGSEGGETWNFD